MDDKFEFSKLFTFFDDRFTWDNYSKQIKDIRQTRSADKRIVAQNSVLYDLDSDSLPQKRFFSDIGSAHFECFLNIGKEKRLVVFLNGARTINQGKALQTLPFFTRWSFYNYIDHSILAITDPMFYTFPDCKLGWYLGTQKENYRRYTAQLIKNIAGKLGIAEDDIVIYGSSGGGTAAIEIASFIKGSSVVAINPQLDMKNYPYFDKFEKDTGISLVSYDNHENNYDPVETIIKNKDSKVLILINIQCYDDFDVNLKYLCSRLDIRPDYGLSEHGDLYIWLYDAEGAPSPHTSQDSNVFFRGIMCVLNAIKNGESIKSVNGYVKLLNELWTERFSLVKKNRDMNHKLRELEEKIGNSEDEAVTQAMNPVSFQLKKLGDKGNSAVIEFHSNSCVLFATRYSSQKENNISATIMFDYWSKDISGSLGSFGKVKIKKDRLSRKIHIVNESPFTVSFIMIC